MAARDRDIGRRYISGVLQRKNKAGKEERRLKDVACTRKISDIFKTSVTATADSHAEGTTENVSSCSTASECTTTPIFLAVEEDTSGKTDDDSAETLVCTEAEVPSSTTTHTLQYEDPTTWPGIITCLLYTSPSPRDS